MVCKIGDKGTIVKLIQQKLGLDDDGIFGRDTKKRIIEFQLKHSIAPTGAVDQETWDKLFQTKKSQTKTPTKVISIVDVANKVIKQYKNNGTKYSQSNRQVGLNAKYADCSSTVSTIIELSGLKSKLSTTNTRSMAKEIKSKGKFRKNDPLAGDIMMWGGHVTIVTVVKNGFVYFAHMGGSGPRIGRVTLSRNKLNKESTWGSGGFIGFWTIS